MKDKTREIVRNANLLADNDLRLYGIFVIHNGKRVDPKDVYINTSNREIVIKNENIK